MGEAAPKQQAHNPPSTVDQTLPVTPSPTAGSFASPPEDSPRSFGDFAVCCPQLPGGSFLRLAAPLVRPQVFPAASQTTSIVETPQCSLPTRRVIGIGQQPDMAFSTTILTIFALTPQAATYRMSWVGTKLWQSPGSRDAKGWCRCSSGRSRSAELGLRCPMTNPVLLTSSI
ncbi:hypothetical protein N657DRAFT_483413 [Parathielavia appendiculata]|uniref:Uncharacterized protein n=1 Tax=Parathielavia appendiculata TaxID=2587402 RepID=A0AAN6TY38_9PEZI|nr:hypothetical protein N657DRAFT_483413 [Parathielavia appendiculata]